MALFSTVIACAHAMLRMTRAMFDGFNEFDVTRHEEVCADAHWRALSFTFRHF